MIIQIGGGFLSTLTIVFVILKALGYLDWSWWLVFLPILIPFGIILFICVVIFIAYMISELIG